MEIRDRKGKPLKVLSEGGQRLVQLEENQVYHLAVQLVEVAREGWSAWLGERELELKAEGFLLETRLWSSPEPLPLRLQSPGGEQQYLQVEIQPPASKLRAEDWATMLRDLHAWLPGSTVGQEGGRHGAVEDSGAHAPGVAAVLGELLPAFVVALGAVVRAPRERAAEHWAEVPLHTVRQVEGSTLRWLAHHPDAWQRVQGLAEESSEGRQVLVPQRAQRGHLDHPANRYVAWLVREVLRTLQQVAERVRKQTEKSRRSSLDPDLVDWCQGRLERIAEGSKELEELLRRSGLAKLPVEPPSEAALLTLMDDPAYARLHRLGQIFRLPRFKLNTAQETVAAPVRPSYELYELWTFLAMRRLLEPHLPGAEWSEEGVATLSLFDERPGKAVDVGFRARWPGHGTLRLLFNPTFPRLLKSKGRETRERWSISMERRPDIVLSWQPNQGQPRWLCLDAKYRTAARQLEEAFESAHLYHDSLRWEGFGDKGRCAGAMLLVPAMLKGTEPWFHKDFRNEHGVGTFQLTPGQPGQQELIDWIGEALGLPDKVRLDHGDIQRP